MKTSGSVLYSLGGGVPQVMQGIVASYTSVSIAGQIYAGIAMVELLAGLTGGLTFARIFEMGLNLASTWGLGLPFFVAAVSLFDSML